MHFFLHAKSTQSRLSYLRHTGILAGSINYEICWNLYFYLDKFVSLKIIEARTTMCKSNFRKVESTKLSYRTSSNPLLLLLKKAMLRRHGAPLQFHSSLETIPRCTPLHKRLWILLAQLLCQVDALLDVHGHSVIFA